MKKFKKVCVTGGKGFIGRSLVRELQESAETVVVLDPRCGQADSCSGVEAHKFDLTGSQEQLSEFIDGSDVVFHLAASTDMTWKPGAQLRDLTHGTVATLNLLEAMRQMGLKNLVFTSSSAVYGDLARQGAGETDGPLMPCSTYGAAKLSNEGWVSAYTKLFEWRTLVVRPGNVIGSGMDRGILFDVVAQLQQGPSKITLRGDGTQGRSYILVDELAQALVHLWQTLPAQTGSHVVNVSGEGMVTSRELVEAVKSELSLDTLEIDFPGDERGWPGDVPQVRLSVEALRSSGFPVRSSLEAVRVAISRMVRGLADEGAAA